MHRLVWNAPLGYAQNFNMSLATLFAEGVETLQPGATGRDLIALLDGRANRTTALDWKAGRRHAPRWAMQLIADKIRAEINAKIIVADKLARSPDRPGLKAGAINLARYRARNS